MRSAHDKPNHKVWASKGSFDDAPVVTVRGSEPTTGMALGAIAPSHFGPGLVMRVTAGMMAGSPSR